MAASRSPDSLRTHANVVITCVFSGWIRSASCSCATAASRWPIPVSEAVEQAEVGVFRIRRYRLLVLSQHLLRWRSVTDVHTPVSVLLDHAVRGIGQHRLDALGPNRRVVHHWFLAPS